MGSHTTFAFLQIIARVIAVVMSGKTLSMALLRRSVMVLANVIVEVTGETGNTFHVCVRRTVPPETVAFTLDLEDTLHVFRANIQVPIFQLVGGIV